MATEIDAARLLLYRACAFKDAGQPFGSEAAMAKLYCSTTATRVTNLALQIHGGYGYSKEYDVERYFRDLQIHGGYGYSKEYDVERYFRDAKVTEIYEGTSEVQRMVVARSVLSQLT